jgi:hypothetical protein
MQWPVILVAAGLLAFPFVWTDDCGNPIPIPYVAASIVIGSLLAAFVVRMALLATRPPRRATFEAGCVGVGLVMGVGWLQFISEFARCFNF